MRARLREVQDRNPEKFGCTKEGSTGGRNSKKSRCTSDAVQKTRLRSATPGSSILLARAVQDRDYAKFMHTNKGSTGGRDSE
jgi:hypothetical protein